MAAFVRAVSKGIAEALQHYQAEHVRRIRQEAATLSLAFLAACINNGHRMLCLCDEMVAAHHPGLDLAPAVGTVLVSHTHTVCEHGDRVARHSVYVSVGSCRAPQCVSVGIVSRANVRAPPSLGRISRTANWAFWSRSAVTSPHA